MTASNRDRMLAGEVYDSSDPALVADRRRAQALLREINGLDMTDPDRHAALLAELGIRLGRDATIMTPFRCAYGFNVAVGERSFLNYDCLLLDCGRIEIGARTMLGPAVQIYTAVHPLDPVERASNRETAEPVTIGDDVWIGGAAVILPGVRIGDRAVVGAGAVVTKPVPAGGVAVGNPARLVRTLDHTVGLEDPGGNRP